LRPSGEPADASEVLSGPPSARRKQSLYFPESMLEEINGEASRLDRSLSWIVQRAWKVARPDIRKIPGSQNIGASDPGEKENQEP
jgi:uncharacterized small protein (TIGR04563 family)